MSTTPWEYMCLANLLLPCLTGCARSVNGAREVFARRNTNRLMAADVRLPCLTVCQMSGLRLHIPRPADIRPMCRVQRRQVARTRDDDQWLDRIQNCERGIPLGRKRTMPSERLRLMKGSEDIAAAQRAGECGEALGPCSTSGQHADAAGNRHETIWGQIVLNSSRSKRNSSLGSL